MKTTKLGNLSGYWPLALAFALIVIAALHAYGDGMAAREPLAADRVTAELARAVSYGIIDADAGPTAIAVRDAVAPASVRHASPM